MSKPVYGRKYKTNDMWLEYSSLNEAARKPNLYKGKKAKQEPTNSSWNSKNKNFFHLEGSKHFYNYFLQNPHRHEHHEY